MNLQDFTIVNYYKHDKQISCLYNSLSFTYLQYVRQKTYKDKIHIN